MNMSKALSSDKEMGVEKKAMPIFEVAKNINARDGRLDADEVGYNPFMTNRIYSMTPDSVLFANEMNRFWNLTNQQQYDFYYYGMDRNPRRFGRWQKKDTGLDDDLGAIMEAFSYSRAKALEVWPILKDRMDDIRKFIFKGGKE